AAVNADPPSPLAHIVAEAEKIQERLQDLEEIAKEENNAELKELVQKLKDKAEEMKQPEVDEKEALAKLSEMHAAIQASLAPVQCPAAVMEFAESIKVGKSALAKASKKLAKELGNQAKRNKLNMPLNRELDDLKECKCNRQCNSLVTGHKPQKSKSPSSTW